MHRRSAVIPVFFIFLILALLLFFLPHAWLSGPLEQVTLPVRKALFIASHKEKPQTLEDKLREENSKLLTELAKQKELEKENKALRDQFQTPDPAPRKLLPASVVGLSTDQVIIDKGIKEGIDPGSIVVVKNNLVGSVVKAFSHLAIVDLTTRERVSFTAKASKTGALGIIKGSGGNKLIFDNVVLSDKLEKDDVVVTKGDVDEKGRGYPPGLVVGKIMSVNKKASNVFQRADVQSLVDFEKLEVVFVMHTNASE